MRYYCKQLKDHYPIKGGTLRCYLFDNPWEDYDEAKNTWSRPAVIVVPGGSYYFVSKREGEMVVGEFLAKGFQCFVLEYLVSPQGVHYPEQLFELSCAIDFVRKHAKEYNVKEDEIFTIGFSAGGHLVADQSCEHNTVPDRLGVKLQCKPTAVALSYAVINDEPDTFSNLLCGSPEDEKAALKKRLMVNKLVGKHTPPTFIWATAQDGLVPAENSLVYATALARKKVPYELHIYPRGDHGKSTGEKEINGPADAVSTYEEWKPLTAWVGDCIRFFNGFRRGI